MVAVTVQPKTQVLLPSGTPARERSRALQSRSRTSHREETILRLVLQGP
jgi:DNA-binding CsgD family transcriptional regulator